MVHEIMATDTHQVAERHKEGQEMLKALGGFGPTMGIIGTVMGLINVLSHLSDPDNLGHSIATAFIATLYGVVIANIVWLPMANKLKRKNHSEITARQASTQGVLVIQAGENPRVVREKLETFLSPKSRGQNGNGSENA
jgi:chemotaxis protein MotA